MAETAYLSDNPNGTRLAHEYGERVHILADPWSMSILARLSSPDVHPPVFHQLLHAAYRRLMHASSEQLISEVVDLPTRMTAIDPSQRFTGRILKPDQDVVIVDIARGGMIPSHIYQLGLLEFIRHERVRVDHIYMQRKTQPDGKVIGVELHGSKIGGPVAGRTVFIPDPMGATGSSVAHVIQEYQRMAGGPPSRIVTSHLIVTPEYLRKVTALGPDVHVYAMRVDRGGSPADVLEKPPGADWDRESGLTDNDYIIPGAGGLGEIISNAFV